MIFNVWEFRNVNGVAGIKFYLKAKHHVRCLPDYCKSIVSCSTYFGLIFSNILSVILFALCPFAFSIASYKS